jgi:hypothetical protein
LNQTSRRACVILEIYSINVLDSLGLEANKIPCYGFQKNVS